MENSEDLVEDKSGYRHWGACTWNNPPQDWFLEICKSGCDYASGQLEKAPDTGTVHAQFYLYFTHVKKLANLKKKLPKCYLKGVSVNLAETKWNYCKKTESALPDTWKEWGRKPRFCTQGKINKYNDALDHCKTGNWEFADAEMQVKYHTNLSKLTAHYAEALDPNDLRGHWISGPPGSGKSSSARSHWQDEIYIKSQNKWWDNYRGEPTVILDDLDQQGSCLSHLIKIWADRYPVKGEIKGGTVPLNFKRFIVTSNYLPADIWPGEQNAILREAITRRFRFYRVTGQYPTFQLVEDSEVAATDAFAIALKAFISK